MPAQSGCSVNTVEYPQHAEEVSNTNQDPLGSPGPHCTFSHFRVPFRGRELEIIERLEAQALQD